jgi:alginate O-acetyltransferase complex protein AlgJ
MKTASVPKHTLLCASVFSALMVFGGYQMISAATNPDGLIYPATMSDFREGRSTQTLEKQLDHKLPVRQAFITFANSMRYQLLGGGGDQVRIGRDGWLFLTDEVKYEADPNQAKFNDPTVSLKIRVDLITEVSRRLTNQGVQLIVALVPDKARLYGSRLSSQQYPIYNESRYQDALRALLANQVNVVNLLAPMRLAAQSNEIYYRTDTHWNQAGAKLAAKELADFIAKLNLNYPKIAFNTTAQTAAVERSGDLIRLMGVEHAPEAFKPKSDREAIETTALSKSDTAPAQGLFGDASVPVVLVGTSYSLRGNFHGQLQQALSTTVLNTAKDGGGFLQSITAYLNDEAFRTSKPQAIVWEIPERMLRSTIDAERSWLTTKLSSLGR